MEIKRAKYAYPIGLTSQFYFCGMPFRLDTYRGCPAHCVYCYVRSRGGNYNERIQYAEPKLIRRWFDLALEQFAEPKNQVIECLQRRVPIHFGGMSDPFLIPSPFQHITAEVLRILDKFQYPTLISTKSDIIGNPEFADILLGKPHFALQFSFSTFNDDIAAFIEPKAPLPSRRLKGAMTLIENGHWVACRLQPYFPGQDIDNFVSFISSFGFNHVTMEHFKLPFDSKINIRALNAGFSTSILDFFPKGKRIKRGREFEMPNEIRLQSIQSFLKAAKRYGISIGIGDNGFQHLSSSPCCCGIDGLPGFENWYKHNVAVAVWRTKSNRTVKYESIANEWVPKSSISRMINSKTRLKTSFDSVRNHIKRHWDSNGQCSPSMFYNVVAEKSGDSHKYYFKENLSQGIRS